MNVVVVLVFFVLFFFFKQKTAYEMRISDWSSDVCSSDLPRRRLAARFLVAVDHHVITDAPRERRRFERGERGEDHRNARLHVGGAWAVEHPGFEPFERLERMVDRKSVV